MRKIVTQLSQSYERRVLALGRFAERAFQSRYGLWFLGSISFIESSLVIPVITDPFLVAYILANRMKAQRAIWLTTVTSVLGGIVAYLAASFIIEFFLQTFTAVSPEDLYNMSKHFETGTFLITLLGALTPIPYTIVAIAAGSVHANFFVFVFASFVGRGSRYALVGIATYLIGPRALPLIQKHIRILTIVLSVLLLLYLITRFF